MANTYTHKKADTGTDTSVASYITSLNIAISVLTFFFFFEGLYFQGNFIWKTSILKTRTMC